MTTFAEGWWLWRWFWRVERRRGQALPGAFLFMALVSLLVGLLRVRETLPASAMPVLFWVAYLFTIFQVLPKGFLDIAPESWRWLQMFVSSQGAAWGLLLYMVSWASGLYAGWFILSWGLWAYPPPRWSFLTALSVGLPVGLAAFLSAKARASYATAVILALPLVLAPLLLAFLRSGLTLQTALLLGAEVLLASTLLSLLWEG